jgi:hypothetical protein
MGHTPLRARLTRRIALLVAGTLLAIDPVRAQAPAAVLAPRARGE